MMQPVAVLADIHGNSEALEAVLEAVKPLNPRAYLVLGDSFGEMGASAEVYERLCALNPVWIMGNREWDMAAFCRGERPGWEHAAQFAPMTESAADLGRYMDEIASWPITASWEGLRLAHGSPEGVRELLYPGTPRLDALLAHTQENLTVVGHDHRQWYYEKNGKRILAMGSIGLCHAGRAFRSQYGLLWQEEDRWRGTLCEIGYDGEKLAGRLKKSGWLQRAGVVVRICYEEIACGYEALLAFMRMANRLCEREYGKILSPLPDEILDRTMRIYPWKTKL